MRTVAIDDEPIALTIIEQYSQRFSGIELECFSDPIKGIAEVMRNPPELLLLDIEMGVANGVDVARSLPSTTKLIFTTAYAKFAIDGFELNAVDFLHKPFSYSRFERALHKAKEQIAANKSEQTSSHLTIKSEYQSVQVPINRITYIESMDNYIRIHTLNSTPLQSKMSLKSIYELLPSSQFLRIHKSFVVARCAIQSYNKTAIQLSSPPISVPIGRTYQNDFQEWI